MRSNRIYVTPAKDILTEDAHRWAEGAGNQAERYMVRNYEVRSNRAYVTGKDVCITAMAASQGGIERGRGKIFGAMPLRFHPPPVEAAAGGPQRQIDQPPALRMARASLFA